MYGWDKLSESDPRLYLIKSGHLPGAKSEVFLNSSDITMFILIVSTKNKSRSSSLYTNGHTSKLTTDKSDHTDVEVIIQFESGK